MFYSLRSIEKHYCSVSKLNMTFGQYDPAAGHWLPKIRITMFFIIYFGIGKISYKFYMTGGHFEKMLCSIMHLQNVSSDWYYSLA